MYKESDYYPPGAYNDPSAPWNERDNDPIEVDAQVTVWLTKKGKVWTDQYATYADEDGACGIEYLDHNWQEEWEDQHYAIPEMLDELKNLIEKELTGYKLLSRPLDKDDKHRMIRLKEMLNDCQGWVQDDVEIDHD